eukprot:TRINITY_DN37232_c0_g1_i1.p1 TRINITY_DN37232_c0_g1~~TRINITY_DN37232_c0_g1_i1.p1  ORF type:complete len:432 (+),score=103.01 TRINITY_DN37232_c0_g1_i1:46-1296(+)
MAMIRAASFGDISRRARKAPGERSSSSTRLDAPVQPPAHPSSLKELEESKPRRGSSLGGLSRGGHEERRRSFGGSTASTAGAQGRKSLDGQLTDLASLTPQALLGALDRLKHGVDAGRSWLDFSGTQAGAGAPPPRVARKHAIQQDSFRSALQHRGGVVSQDGASAKRVASRSDTLASPARKEAERQAAESSAAAQAAEPVPAAPAAPPSWAEPEIQPGDEKSPIPCPEGQEQEEEPTATQLACADSENDCRETEEASSKALADVPGEQTDSMLQRPTTADQPEVSSPPATDEGQGDSPSDSSQVRRRAAAWSGIAMPQTEAAPHSSSRNGYLSSAAAEAKAAAAASGSFQDFREIWGSRAATGFAGKQSDLKSRLSRKEAEAALQRLANATNHDLDEVRQMRKLVNEYRDADSER